MRHNINELSFSITQKITTLTSFGTIGKCMQRSLILYGEVWTIKVNANHVRVMGRSSTWRPMQKVEVKDNPRSMAHFLICDSTTHPNSVCCYCYT